MSLSRIKNGWRIVWLIVVYDCPMTEREERRDYTIFRKKILQENFLQLQYSLYARHFSTYAQATAVIARMQNNVPPGASVSFFFVTDKQWAMTQEFYGPKKTMQKPNEYEQISLF
jgi:CRISPR-associated protein Cas2